MTTTRTAVREGGRLTPIRPMGIISPVAERTRALGESGVPIEAPHRFRERVKARVGLSDLLLFRVGGELYALDLVELEEALDLPPLNPVPEMSEGMLGVFSLRGVLVPTYAPDVILGVPSGAPATALVMCGRERRVALAVEDVEDVTTVSLRDMRDPPSAEIDGLLLGVFHEGDRLVGLLDADTLLAACRTDGTLETT